MIISKPIESRLEPSKDLLPSKLPDPKVSIPAPVKKISESQTESKMPTLPSSKAKAIDRSKPNAKD